ncbi:MAG: hypothetical protein TR69_WS6001000397 [candidate division WS6 bacterium OLB20]|uniref:Response regulatory domain-containing protein n=1 Tax=candidate division WS6 bacterium OLB20 TaxID=1617426 RepID=A0A136LXK7_9BACT|nr:MAG: hypothetical protein TR69_WS6001000397 [candidate division WS6 bacterium OLB20]
MDKPVIIQFDGDENYHTVVDLICFNMDLEVSRHANSIKSARRIFADIEDGKLKPTIAIVASFLERDHRDGSIVAKKLREIAPDIKIIGYTVIEDEDWYDELAVKSNRNPEKTVIDVLARLTRHSFKSSNVPV